MKGDVLSLDSKIHIPPLKIQGIKSKIIPHINDIIKDMSFEVWVEPFMGSGVVGFNLARETAIFSDVNPHIINFYNDIKCKKIDCKIIRDYLEQESVKLSQYDSDYFYVVRDRFNENPNSLDFLFLNRSCFNGMMRFNRNGKFNVPYCHKPNRFSKSYITKIVNQVKYVEDKCYNNNWIFLHQDFNDAINSTLQSSLIYCDPPYIDRNADYYNGWNENNEILLEKLLHNTNSKFILSTWKNNKFRKNQYYNQYSWCNEIIIEHFYYIGGKEENRHSIQEALLTNF